MIGTPFTFNPDHYPRYKAFEKALFDGYVDYSKKHEVDGSNDYFVHLKSVQFIDYSSLQYARQSDAKLKKVCTGKFELIKQIESNGFDPNCPILFYVQKFKTILLLDTSIGMIPYNAIDGNHRIAIAHHLGMKSLPGQFGVDLNLPVSAEEVERATLAHNWTWYQPIDFGVPLNIPMDHQDGSDHGKGKYFSGLRQSLSPKGKVIVDLGCNTGLITSCIAGDGARFVVGVDYPSVIEQARYVKDRLWSNFGNLHFVSLDLLKDDLRKFLSSLPKIDCILMSNVLYYMGDKADDIIQLCSYFSNKIVLQGNSLKTEHGQPSTRLSSQPNYRGEYATVDGMESILKKHGFVTNVDEIKNKPIVSGVISKNIDFSLCDDIHDLKVRSWYISEKLGLSKATFEFLDQANNYGQVGKFRIMFSVATWKTFYSGGSILDIGGTPLVKRCMEMEGITDYAMLNQEAGDVRSVRLPYEDGSVDNILAWEIIEHLWSFQDDGLIGWKGITHFWSECHRILKPGGKFFLTTTNRFCPRTFRCFCNGLRPQIYPPIATEKELLKGHCQELSSADLRNIAMTTQMFVNSRIWSENCYSHVHDIPYDSDEFKKWVSKFRKLLGRDLQEDETGDTLFFMSTK